jgi:hypothetical protein
MTFSVAQGLAYCVWEMLWLLPLIGVNTMGMAPESSAQLASYFAAGAYTRFTSQLNFSCF